MSTLTSQTLQLVAQYLTIAEFVVMLYALLLNPRHAANRGAAALFMVIMLNTLSIGLLLDPTPLYRIGLPLYVATTTLVVAGLLIVTVMVIKFEWLPVGLGTGVYRVWWLVYVLGALPVVLTLVDVAFGTRLWYTPPAGYAGGFVPIGEAASGVISGFLRGPMTYVMGALPILLLIYVLARDRKARSRLGEPGSAVTRQFAWLLLAAQVVSLVLMSTLRGPVLSPLMALVVGALYTAVFASAAFRQMISERRAQAGRVQTRLTILLLAVALPLFAGLIVVLLSRADAALQFKSDEQLATANRSVVSNTTTWLDLNVAALNDLVMQPQIIGMDAAQQKPILEAMAAAYPQMYLVSTTDPQGINVARNDAGKLTDYSDRAWYKGAIGGATLTLQPLIGRTTGRPALVASAPIQRAPGVIVGVGMFASELTDVGQQVQLSTVGEAGFSYVVDAGDLVVAYPQTMPAGLGEMSSSVPITPLGDLSDYPPVKALRAGSRGRIEFTDKAGHKWQAYVDEMESGWGVVVQQPNDDFLSGLRGLQQIALLFTIGGVLLLLIMTVLTVRQALSPVGRLTETTTAIAGGDLQRTAQVESEDEFGTLARAFNRMTGRLRDLIGGLEQRVVDRTADLERRSAYLQASAEVGRAVGSILDMDALTAQVVDLIRERFGLYYVGLFLTDPAEEWAVLRSATGDAGQAMLARGHRVRLGQGMVGWSITNAQVRVALQAEADAVRVVTPELPETRSEAALPLRSRGRVLGALTVQSVEAEAFDQDAVATLQTMADQVAVALDNARLFAESQSALEAAERAYGQLTSQAWQELLRAQPGMSFRRDKQGLAPAGDAWHPEMAEVMRAGTTLSEQAGEVPARRAGMATPIKVRDQVIGVIDAHKPEAAGDWTAEEVEVMEMLADQLGQALEGARLFREARRHAAHEEAVRRVTDEMRRGLDMESILQTTVAELGRVLGVPRAYVRLGTGVKSEPDDPGSGR